MITYADAVSKVSNSLRALTKDGRIPRRYILRVLQNISATLISQKLSERGLTQEDSLYTPIDCIELKLIEGISCPIAELRFCRILSRSIKPLPELVFSRLGSSIRNVTNLDNSQELKPVTAKQYRRNKNRRYTFKEDVYYYLGTDNHLYIPDHSISAVNAEILTVKTDEVECNCKKKECKDAWQSAFICPSRLQEVVFKEALQIIGTTFKNIREDENPNNIENG